MAIEIERKFLVRDDSWRPAATRSRHIRQAYLQQSPTLSVRIRIIDNSGAALTIKSGAGLSRHEFEYAIPVADAEQLLSHCIGIPIMKTRHDVPLNRVTWEIDVFEAENAGLIVAEIELESEGQHVELPAWAGQEVTGMPRYLNASLTEQPFLSWRRALK